MTDAEILAIKNVHMPGKGHVTVDEIWQGQVLYAVKPEGQDGWFLYRKPKASFIKAWQTDNGA